MFRRFVEQKSFSTNKQRKTIENFKNTQDGTRNSKLSNHHHQNTLETIDHQPMAVGYMVSTAPANDLPDWFWSNCPSAKRQLPVHLKNALHINSSNIHEELEAKTGNETFHPLDDRATEAILR